MRATAMEEREAQTHTVLIVAPLACINVCNAALQHFESLLKTSLSKLGCVAVREAKEDLWMLRDHRLALLLVCKDYRGPVAPETLFEPF